MKKAVRVFNADRTIDVPLAIGSLHAERGRLLWLLNIKNDAPRRLSSQQDCRPLRPSELSGQSIAFDVEQLVEASNVAFFVRELSRHKCADQFHGYFITDDACSETEDVHVVVFDSLMSRIDVVADSRANARNLVRRHTDPDAAAAEQNAPLCLSGEDRLTHLSREVGIIDRTIRVGSAIDDIMPRRLHDRDDSLFQREPAVITSKGDTHFDCSYLYRLLANAVDLFDEVIQYLVALARLRACRRKKRPEYGI